MRRYLPFLMFVLLVVVLAWALARPGDRYVPSRLVGQPMPALKLDAIVPGKAAVILPADGPRLVNIFASWCVPCVAEAPMLERLAEQGATIDGIALRDRPADVAQFLVRHGDPFARVGADPFGRAQIALGASGVPETFVVDGRGIIRLHHVGPIEAGDIAAIRNALEEAR